MTLKENWIELSVICVGLAALAIVGIVWNITSGLLTSGIDGIMLLFVCLMMGGIFSLMLLVLLYQAGMLPFFRRSSEPAATPAPAPAVQPSQQAK
jgi:hypothetical protein